MLPTFQPTHLGPVPGAVENFAAGRRLELVWRNLLGGLTYRVADSGEDLYAKWSVTIDLRPEVDRLVWLFARWAHVPEVVSFEEFGGGQLMVTRGMAGTSAVAPAWIADPARAVAAIGEGLAALHAEVAADECPFPRPLAMRIDAARAELERRISLGENEFGLGEFSGDHERMRTSVEMLEILETPPPESVLVTGHGDSCAPNTLISDDGRWIGLVDMGELGVCDPWSDLALATWSTQWNYGPGFSRELLAAYGIEPDEERTLFYRALQKLG